MSCYEHYWPPSGRDTTRRIEAGGRYQSLHSDSVRLRPIVLSPGPPSRRHYFCPRRFMANGDIGTSRLLGRKASALVDVEDFPGSQCRVLLPRPAARGLAETRASSEWHGGTIRCLCRALQGERRLPLRPHGLQRRLAEHRPVSVPVCHVVLHRPGTEVQRCEHGKARVQVCPSCHGQVSIH